MRVGRAPETAEIPFYDDAARDARRRVGLASQLEAVADLRSPWATPLERWVDAPYDSAAQADTYRHVEAVIAGGTLVQLGGSGKDAIKALLGGASRSYLITPVEGEAELARRLAYDLGVADQFEALLGTGEEIPLGNGSVDALLSAGCFHHTDVPRALLEIRRVLRAGGKFAAWDPWHARLYDIGVALFGKREPGIECRPLNAARLSQLPEIFPVSEIRLHGALTRYPLLALSKFGLRASQPLVHKMTLLDDRIAARISVLRRNGSSVAVLATKEA
jgi:SAM-dependent methyltransferase